MAKIVEVPGLWQALLDKAENSLFEEEEAQASEKVIEITVAEVLAQGYEWYNPPAAAIVRDTNGKIWILPETQEINGLKRSYYARPFMQLSLKIEEVPCVKRKTKAFVKKL